MTLRLSFTLLALACVAISSSVPALAAPKKAKIAACDGSVRKCDGSVRNLAAGPVHIGLGESLKSALLFPALKNATAEVTIVNRKGVVLETRTFTVADGHTEKHFDVSFDISIDNKGEISIGDGSVRKVIGISTDGEDVSILIGLLLPAIQKVQEPAARMHTGSLQLIGRAGNTQAILPYVEQQGIIAVLIGL